MFPPNPTPGEIYQIKPGIFYTYDDALKSWVLTSGNIPEPTSTEISNGLMRSSDYVKLLSYPLDIKQTSIQGQDCQVEYVSGNVTLSSADSFLEIATTAQFPQQPLLPELPMKISNNTYAIDFSLNLPALAEELKSRGQYIATGPSGTSGDQGPTGPRGYDNVPCGPAGAQGLSGTAPACTINSTKEYLQATGATQRVITDVTVAQGIDPTTYDLSVTRELLASTANAAQFVNITNDTSDWLVVTNNPNPGTHGLYYVDAEPIISSIENKFKAELTLLKNGYENVVEYWLKTMSVLYDEQRQALCCALERCISMTKNDSARQHMESVAANAAGVAKIRLNPRGSSDTVTVGGDALKSQIGQSAVCPPGGGFGGGGVIISTSTTVTTPAPTTTTQALGAIVPGPGPDPAPGGGGNAGGGGGGGAGGGNAGGGTPATPVTSFCDISGCNVSNIAGAEIGIQIYQTSDYTRQIPCPEDLSERLRQAGVGDRERCFKINESWSFRSSATRNTRSVQCWNGQWSYPVGENPFGFGVDGGTQGIIMPKYEDIPVDPRVDTTSIGKKYNIFIHIGVFCLTIQGIKDLYLLYKVVDRAGVITYAEWAIRLADIQNTPINAITGGWGTAKYPGDTSGSTFFSVYLPFVPLALVTSEGAKLRPDTFKELEKYRLILNVNTLGQATVITTPAPIVGSYITAVGCQGTTNPAGLNGLTALTPLVLRELSSCLEFVPRKGGGAALGGTVSKTYFVALRLKKAKSLGVYLSNGDYKIKISSVFKDGYKVNIYSYSINSNGEFAGLGGLITSYGNDNDCQYTNNAAYTEDSFTVPLRTSQDYIITITAKQFKDVYGKLVDQVQAFYLAVFPPNAFNLPGCTNESRPDCKGQDLFPDFSGTGQDYVFIPGD